MPDRRQMLDSFDVIGPLDLGWILWSGDAELEMRQATRRFNQKLLERRLPVAAVGPEIGEMPFLRHLQHGVGVWIDRAVKRPRAPRSELPLNAPECRSAGERQIEVVAGDDL